MSNAPVIWHYTYGQNYQKIIADQAILPSSAYLGGGALAVVWFSRNPVWESSAAKGLITDDGTVENLTMDGLRLHGGGLYRFGVAREAAPYQLDDLLRLSEISKGPIAELRRSAKRCGANVKDWFFSVEPVKKDAWLTVEGFDSHQWASALFQPPPPAWIHA